MCVCFAEGIGNQSVHKEILWFVNKNGEEEKHQIRSNKRLDHDRLKNNSIGNEDNGATTSNRIEKHWACIHEKYGPALKACRKALYYAEISHSDYQLASVHKSIAALHKIQGKTNASIPHLEMAIRLCPDDTSNYSRLSLSLVSEGRSRETHKYMRKLNNLTGKKFIR